MNHPAAPAIFAYFDGDDVGARIELSLIEDNPLAAAEVSKRVTAAVIKLASALESQFEATILFAAGDEVLASVRSDIDFEGLDALRQGFHQGTGLTISCGVGRSGQEAAFQLRLAKLRGKNRLNGGLDG